ncbi:hypothetical protein Bbelb_132820 [Branchiostoma belcheri]|nr:hypothetical protein Bbelb_132820 [Branchiostoma belcheri]
MDPRRSTALAPSAGDSLICDNVPAKQWYRFKGIDQDLQIPEHIEPYHCDTQKARELVAEGTWPRREFGHFYIYIYTLGTAREDIMTGYPSFKPRSQLAVRASACCLRAKTWANVGHPCVPMSVQRTDSVSLTSLFSRAIAVRTAHEARECHARCLRHPCLLLTSKLTCSMTTQNTRAPYQVLRTCNARATHLISTVYKDDLTGDCQLVSKMPRKAQKKSTRQDPKKRAAEDTRAASDDEVNRRCTHLQRASTACTRQRGNRTEIVRCKHVQLTYHLRNVRCTQPLTARRVVQTTYVHLASDVLPRPATLRLQKKRSRRSHDKNVRTKSTHGEL